MTIDILLYITFLRKELYNIAKSNSDHNNLVCD